MRQKENSDSESKALCGCVGVVGVCVRVCGVYEGEGKEQKFLP